MTPFFLLFLLTATLQLQVGDTTKTQNIHVADVPGLTAKSDQHGLQENRNISADNFDLKGKTLGRKQDTEVSHTSDFSITVGLPVTPNRQATDTDTGALVWNQESRIGPSVGITFCKWLSIHNGLFAEVGYSNTNTRLADYGVNTWTMNRVTVDGGYTYRWTFGRITPYVKVGCGAMVFISGMALNNTSAGLDDRMEGLAGSGVDYSFSRRLSLKVEYEGRFIRNSDFSDITWRPQRNWISEPRIGITYTFGHSR